MRLVLEHSGLTGNRTDYFGGSAGAIDTFDVFNHSGDFALATTFSFSGLDLRDSSTWLVSGAHRIDPDLVRVPEPASLALVVLGLAAAVVVSRRRKGN
jgi:hypothetical protein